MERDARTATLLKALWLGAFTTLGLLVTQVVVAFPPDGFVVSGHVLYPLCYLFASGICFTRAVKARREREIWSMFGAAILANGLSWIYYYVALDGDPSPPYPSAWDGLSMCFYVASFVALMLMLRTRLHRFSKSLWLDAVTGVLALAAVTAALFVRPILAETDAGTAAVLTTVAFLIADIMTLALVVGMFALSGWRPERRWLLIGVAWTIQVVADSFYFHDTVTAGFHLDTLLEPSWAVVGLLIAYAAWQPSDKPPIRFEGWQVLAVPIGFTIVAMGVLIYGNFAPLDPISLVLAILALASSLIGTIISYLEQRKLEVLAKRDALTGLFNYREFHRRLDEQLAAVRGENHGHKLAVVLMDVDGFKDVNDLRGHAEGDRVLREVARAIAGGKRGADTAARLGGDEFGVLMPDTDAEGATALARRMSERVDRLGEGIGISYGAAEWPTDGPAKELLLLRADVAMYAVKSGAAESPPTASFPEDGRRAEDNDSSGARRRGRVAAIDAEQERDKAQLRAYAEAVRVTYAQGLERAQQLKQNYLATVLTLASAVEAKDEYTGGHINRVHRLGLLLARELVPEEADNPQMAYGFLLHDIGKLAVPDEILNKTGPLTDQEWELMREHPEAGVRILAPIPFLGRAIDVVRHHHERWDGCGYPAGLAGEEIPMWSRIFAVVDAVDAMTSDRPYRAALSLEVAHEELKKGAGTQLDPICVAAFMRLDRGLVESLIQTSSTVRTLGAGAVPATALAGANARPVGAD